MHTESCYLCGHTQVCTALLFHWQDFVKKKKWEIFLFRFYSLYKIIADHVAQKAQDFSISYFLLLFCIYFTIVSLDFQILFIAFGQQTLAALQLLVHLPAL